MIALLLYIPDAPLRFAGIASAVVLVAQLGSQWLRNERKLRVERERAQVRDMARRHGAT